MLDAKGAAMRLALACALPAALAMIAASSAAQDTPAKQIFGTLEAPSAGSSDAIGSYSSGCLAGGTALAGAAPGWVVMNPSRNRNWGHPNMIAFVQRLAAGARTAGWPGIYVGDISQPRGGPMITGHSSHQTGLDADIWLRRPDRMDLTPRERDEMWSTVVVAEDGKSVNSTWTPGHGAMIRAAAQDPAVARIFVNPAIKRGLCEAETATDPAGRAWLAAVRPWAGHDAHFHVRLQCPAGDRDCQDQSPVPAGDGCGADLERWFTKEAETEMAVATRGVAIGQPELTLGDLPAACRSVVLGSASQTAAAVSSAVPPPPPPGPMVRTVTAIYGIEGSEYLWVIPGEAGNDGESGMTYSTQGGLPPGLELARGLNGRGLVRGVPTAAGNYRFAILGHGAGAGARYDVSLEIEPRRTGGGTSGAPASGRTERVERFVREFAGGTCFFARPERILDAVSEIEIFGADPTPMYRMDAEFHAVLGFEPRIGGRIVASAQCAAVDAVNWLAGTGAAAPSIQLDDAIVGPGDFVAGWVRSPAGYATTLLAIDTAGAVEMVAEAFDGSRRFNWPASRAMGPGLLLALSAPVGAAPLTGADFARNGWNLQTLIANERDRMVRSGVALKYFLVR
jgi:penicillin-insensitive murein endopeptidase